MKNMASSRRKQDEKHLKILRELGSNQVNRTCFDCHQKGPTYINMTIGSFVCTTCSGILRGLNPPHRVKSISMASFTPDEIEQIKSKGNQYCQAVWLGLYDGKSSLFPDTKDEHKIREFMISKYEKKRFYVEPSVALKNLGNSQPKSGSSSNASTPGSSDSRSLGNSNPTSSNFTSTSISRPVANLPTAVSSPCLNGLSQSSVLKPSSSVDLLSNLGGDTKRGQVDPFSSSTTNKTESTTQLGGFANFDNANIFTNSSSSISKPPSHLPPFSSNPLTPLSSSSKYPSSTNAPVSTAGLSVNAANQISEDRYAALKDLDEIFKTQKEIEKTPSTTSGSTLFGSSPGSASGTSFSGVTNGGVNNPPNGAGGQLFGTSPVNSGAGFYPQPTNPAWNAPGFNPFSGNTNANSNNLWANNSLFGAASQNQANPFAGGVDPNFNSQFGINGTTMAPNANWASFGSPQAAQNGGPAGPKAAANPWPSNSTQNPFKTSQIPLGSGSSYNPFL